MKAAHPGPDIEPECVYFYAVAGCLPRRIGVPSPASCDPLVFSSSFFWLLPSFSLCPPLQQGEPEIFRNPSPWMP